MKPLSDRSSNRYFVAGRVIDSSLEMSASVVRAFLESSFRIMRSLASNPPSLFEGSLARVIPRPLLRSSSHWFQSNLQVLLDLEVLDEKIPLRTLLLIRDLSAHMENMADLGVDVVDLIRVIALTA